MNNFSLYRHLVMGDFWERTRRYSFLITLGFVLYMGYTFIPPNHSNYVTLQLGGHRGIYNSAWIGALAAMHTALFMSIAGFYLVKNSIARDRQTGVGQILAATRMSKVSYLGTKGLSNFLVLTAMIFVVMISTAGMQILRAEDVDIRPWQIISPFLLITLPVLSLVAVIAILFESIKWLRGGLGNVVFFFLWIFTVSSETFDVNSIMGVNSVLKQMRAATHAAFPDFDLINGPMSMGFNIAGEGKLMHLTTFEWSGIEWTAGTIAERLFLYGLAFGVIILASLFFDRFDSQIEQAESKKKWWQRRKSVSAIEENEKTEVVAINNNEKFQIHLSRLTAIPNSSRFGQMFVAEMKLMLKGVSRWWQFVALGMIIVGLSIPIEASRQILLPLTWVWPILLWSKMGTREARYRTDQILFSSPRSLWRQFPAVWLTGVVLAMLTGSGIGIRLLFAGENYALFAWFVGAMFIPTMALAMGVWTGNGKLFEIIYLLLWYAGPMNKVPGLDYMGSSLPALTSGTPNTFFIVTIILFLLALAGRKRQLTI